VNQDKAKYALITGAASGIGAALARECAQAEMNLILVDTNEQELLNLQNQLEYSNSIVKIFVVDVSNAEQVSNMAKSVLDLNQQITFIFNNAGVLKVAPLLEHTANDWNWVLGVNLLGAVNVTKAFAPTLLKQKINSHIIFTASLASFTTGPGLAAYKVSKHALLAFSEILYYETLNTNINVSVVCPGWVNTSIMDSELRKPQEFVNESDEETDEIRRHKGKGVLSASNGQDPNILAKQILEGTRNKNFYIIPENSFEERFNRRNSFVINRENPDW
jgi:short-subunit dehydrogenase